VLPGAWAPTLAALAVTGLAEGKPGVRALLGRLVRWRVGLRWYAAVGLSLAGMVWAARGLYAALGGERPAMTLPPGVPPEAWPVAVPMILALNLLVGGPLAEELGWRGLALEKLRARHSTLVAALIVGSLWAAWHLPFFMLAGGEAVTGGLPFGWYALLVTAWSVQMAWAYANTGSLLLPVLVHAGANTLIGTLGLVGHGDRSAGLLATYVGLNWLVVAGVAAVFGRGLVRRRAALGAKAARGETFPKTQLG
jgi:membrane protease YdiL (CAAX protease family)